MEFSCTCISCNYSWFRAALEALPSHQQNFPHDSLASKLRTRIRAWTHPSAREHRPQFRLVGRLWAKIKKIRSCIARMNRSGSSNSKFGATFPVVDSREVSSGSRLGHKPEACGLVVRSSTRDADLLSPCSVSRTPNHRHADAQRRKIDGSVEVANANTSRMSGEPGTNKEVAVAELGTESCGKPWELHR